MFKNEGGEYLKIFENHASYDFKVSESEKYAPAYLSL